jgi:flagellar protein FliS
LEHNTIINEGGQMNAVSAMKQYQQVSVHSGIMDASPHRLVQMLMEGALEKIALAKGNMTNNEIANKGENISKAIAIIGGLQSSLNKDAGGEIAENLNSLYDYMSHRLVIANLRNDESILDEIAGLMVEIKMGWDGIPDTFKN